jgi:hypothetical protein
LAKGEKAAAGEETERQRRKREKRGGESGNDIGIGMEVAEAMPAMPPRCGRTEAATKFLRKNSQIR